MKGVHRKERGSRRKQINDPILHFLGRFVGESDRENLARINILMLNEIGDSIGQNAGLARPSACDDADMLRRGRNCLELDGVE